jgi:PAS domain S-box-containing protein
LLQEPPKTLSGLPALFDAYDSAGEAIPFDQWPLPRALRGERVQNLEIHLNRPGPLGHFVGLYSAEPVLDSAGNIALAVLTVREIVDAKQGSQQAGGVSSETLPGRQLIENEPGILEAVMEALPVGVAISDKDGNLQKANRAHHRLLGVPMEGEKPLIHHRSLQTWWADSGVPVETEEWASVQAVRTGKVVSDQMFEVERPDGSRVFILNSAAPIWDPAGRIAGAAAVLFDITPLRKIEEELRERESELRLITDAEPVLISYIDSNFCYRRVNKSYERWFGVPAEQARGRHVRDVLGEQAWLAVKPYMEQALRGELVVYERELPYHGGGPRWVHVTYTPHFDEKSGQVLGMVVHVADVGDRILAEKELSRYAEKLRRSNQELEEFAFVVSHDLKEPLRKIQRFGTQIYNRAGPLLPPQEKDYLSRMVSAAERMRIMIDDLLSLSRVISEGQPFSEVDLNDVIQEVLEDLDLTMHHSQAQISVTPLPVVNADRLQIRLLFQNLLSNALKFCLPGTPPQVRVAARRGKNGWVKIVVEDRGIGIDMRQAKRLFQPFQRLHGRTEYEGSGIGLAICRKIVERHGGMISLASKPNHGTRFTIQLPTDPQQMI